MSARVILDRLELCQHGQVVGAELRAARHNVFVALILAIDRNGSSLLRGSKVGIETAAMDDADEKGE